MRFFGYAGYTFHDAGVSIIDEHGDIEFASLSERYTQKKHDNDIPDVLWSMAKEGDVFSQQEDWNSRNIFRGNNRITTRLTNNYQNLKWWKQHPQFHKSLNVGHHRCHAASALYTRPWKSVDDTVIVTCDGSGEYQSMTIQNNKFKILHDQVFPISIGYLWAAFTQSLGMKPNEDEYVVMGLASYGEPVIGEDLIDIFYSMPEIKFPETGYHDTNEIEMIKNASLKKICNIMLKRCNRQDAAASLQYLTNHYFCEDVMKKARKLGSKLVFSGGVAQNIVANTVIRDMFDDVWIDVNPGDGGASLGSAAFNYCKHTGKDKINWKDPYLGYDIKNQIDAEEIVEYILKHKICGIANGRAEFSYRAYGNRSLIADVRYDIKDTVNDIKQRQRYRPFAPAVLAEHSHKYFEGHMNKYMQYTCKSLHDYTSVTHVDGTARVQLVDKDCKSILRRILEVYYERTGVPMLLNTSLNIRGQPMVNDEQQAKDFEKRYGVKVF